MAAKVLKVIQLTEKFVETDAEGEKSEPSFWPNPLWVFLVAVTPIWIWFLVKTIFPAFWKHHPSGSDPSLWLVVSLCVGVTLLFLVIRYFRGNIRKHSSRKSGKKSELNFPDL